MLQALTEHGGLVTPALLSKQEIGKLRLCKRFFCPECKGQVTFRAGEKVIPHFAHRNVSGCSEKGGESVYHMQGKLQLYHWLLNQYDDVWLERYLPDIQQRPDVLLRIAHRMIAVEFQCAVVDPKIIRQRNAGYKKAGIMPIWLMGANCFQRIGRSKIKMNSFTMEMLQKFSSDTGSHLIYYCPDTHRFFKAADLYMTNHHAAVAYLTFHHATDTTFPQIIRSTFLSKTVLYKTWFHEKQRLRLAAGKLYGSELRWRKWLYNHRLHVDHLPPEVHLPIPSQYQMAVPVWHWQSRFLIEFLHPLKIGDCFGLTDVQRFIQIYMKQATVALLFQPKGNPGLEYLDLLVLLGILRKIEAKLFQKQRPIYFPKHIEEAVRADKEVLQKLMETEEEKNIFEG